MKGPLKKSKKRIEQDLARNAIADNKSGYKKAAKYEQDEEVKIAAGETPFNMMGKSPMKENADFKYMPIVDREKDAMNKEDSAMKMAGESPMKMGGSWMSKHSGLKMMKPSPTKLYKKK